MSTISSFLLPNNTFNKTEPPCPYKENGHLIHCKTVLEQASEMESPVIVLTAFSGLVLNIVIILVLKKMMAQRQTQAQIHLLTLAFSDVTICLFYPFMSIWSSFCDPCLPCVRPFVCFYTFNFLVCATVVMLMINRFATLYITFVRAKALSTLRNAMASRNQTPRQILTEMIIYVVVGSALTYLIGSGLLFPCEFSCAFLVIYPVLISTMAILASFVLIRLRFHSISSVANDDFQRLIGFVAFFYVCTLIGAVIVSTESLSKKHSWLRSFINILNSSVNLIIYLVASHGFREAFVNYFRCENGQ